MAARLAAMGHVVFNVDRDNLTDEISLDNDSTMISMQADLATDEELPAPLDAIVHCAAAIPAHVSDDDELYRINQAMAKRVYAHASELDVRTVVNMSSMAVYGDVHVPVVDEGTPPQNPSAYGRAKLESEGIAMAWSRKKPGLASISLRLPGIVGSGSHDNFLSDVMQRLNHGEVVVATNPDARFNNVVHVRELAAFVGFLVHDCPVGHRAVNLAAEKPLTTRSVLKLMRKTSGRMVEITFDNANKSPFLIDFNDSKALGFKPATVEDSVTRFVSESTT